MTKSILIILTLAGFASGREMEVTDRLTVDGSMLLKSTLTVTGAGIEVRSGTSTAYSLAVGTSTNYSFAISTTGDVNIAGTLTAGTFSASTVSVSCSITANGIQNAGATAGISVSAATAGRELDYMEYSSATAAQAAYVTGEVDTNTKLLIHFDGTDAATACTAETGQTITFTGTTKLSTAEKKFGTASLWLDGSSDYVTVPDSADWAFGNNDFTIELWAKFNALPTSGNVFTMVNDYQDSSNKWMFYMDEYQGAYRWNFFNKLNNSYGLDFTVPSGGINTGRWYHLALTRNGNYFRVFQDGVQCGNTVNDTREVSDFSGNLLVGVEDASTHWFNGYIDELRISKGIARWTTNFSPPAQEYALAALQSYSENAIKTQGLYSLKGIATTGAANKTLTRTVSPAIDLSGRTQINFDIRSSTTGSNIKIGLHDSGGTYTEKTPTIISSDTWQTVNWDISAVTDNNKDAIDSVIITIAGAPAANTFYIDNMYAPGNGNNDITFTSGSEKMRIDNSGNVGIGTTIPQKKLEVSGDIYVDQMSGKMIMKSPDGTCYSCGPANGGGWSCSAITCP